MKKLLSIGFLLALIGAGVGYYMYNKPVDKVNAMKTDFEVSAANLVAAFEEDEDSANAKYLDKAVVVSGIVMKSEVKDGITTIYLDTDNPLSSIICQLDKDANQKVQKNAAVRIKGICSGYLSDVILVRAMIL